jgi:hypothetical protein
MPLVGHAGKLKWRRKHNLTCEAHPVTKQRDAMRRPVATRALEAVAMVLFTGAVAVVGTWLGVGRGSMKLILLVLLVGLVVLVSLPEFFRPWPKGRHKKPPS